MSSDKRDAAVAAITNDFQTQAYATEMGQKAVVERHELQNDLTDEFKGLLQELGQGIQQTQTATRELKYLGSAAVHVYVAEVTGTQFFLTQNALGACSELIASEAMKEMKASLMNYFGQRRQLRRSGAAG